MNPQNRTLPNPLFSPHPPPTQTPSCSQGSTISLSSTQSPYARSSSGLETDAFISPAGSPAEQQPTFILNTPQGRGSPYQHLVLINGQAQEIGVGRGRKGGTGKGRGRKTPHSVQVKGEDDGDVQVVACLPPTGRGGRRAAPKDPQSAEERKERTRGAEKDRRVYHKEGANRLRALVPQVIEMTIKKPVGEGIVMHMSAEYIEVLQKENAELKKKVGQLEELKMGFEKRMQEVSKNLIQARQEDFAKHKEIADLINLEITKGIDAKKFACLMIAKYRQLLKTMVTYHDLAVTNSEVLKSRGFLEKWKKLIEEKPVKGPSELMKIVEKLFAMYGEQALNRIEDSCSGSTRKGKFVSVERGGLRLRTGHFTAGAGVTFLDEGEGGSTADESQRAVQVGGAAGDHAQLVQVGNVSRQLQQRQLLLHQQQRDGQVGINSGVARQQQQVTRQMTTGQGQQIQIATISRQQGQAFQVGSLVSAVHSNQQQEVQIGVTRQMAQHRQFQVAIARQQQHQQQSQQVILNAQQQQQQAGRGQGTVHVSQRSHHVSKIMPVGMRLPRIVNAPVGPSNVKLSVVALKQDGGEVQYVKATPQQLLHQHGEGRVLRVGNGQFVLSRGAAGGVVAKPLIVRGAGGQFYSLGPIQKMGEENQVLVEDVTKMISVADIRREVAEEAGEMVQMADIKEEVVEEDPGMVQMADIKEVVPEERIVQLADIKEEEVEEAPGMVQMADIKEKKVPEDIVRIVQLADIKEEEVEEAPGMVQMADIKEEVPEERVVQLADVKEEVGEELHEGGRDHLEAEHVFGDLTGQREPHRSGAVERDPVLSSVASGPVGGFFGDFPISQGFVELGAAAAAASSQFSGSDRFGFASGGESSRVFGDLGGNVSGFNDVHDVSIGGLKKEPLGNLDTSESSAGDSDGEGVNLEDIKVEDEQMELGHRMISLDAIKKEKVDPVEGQETFTRKMLPGWKVPGIGELVPQEQPKLIDLSKCPFPIENAPGCVRRIGIPDQFGSSSGPREGETCGEGPKQGTVEHQAGMLTVDDFRMHDHMFRKDDLFGIDFLWNGYNEDVVKKIDKIVERVWAGVAQERIESDRRELEEEEDHVKRRKKRDPDEKKGGGRGRGARGRKKK